MVRSGPVQFIQQRSIQLTHEQLTFRIDGDYVHVTVTYTLVNDAPATQVEYGFPVDYVQTRRGTGWQEDYVTDFVIADEMRQYDVTTTDTALPDTSHLAGESDWR